MSDFPVEPTRPSNPEDAVAAAFAEVEQARVAAEKALAETEDAGQPGGGVLVPRGRDAAAVKSQAAELYSRAVAARQELAAARVRAQEAVQAQQRALEARLAEQLALLGPLEEQINQAREVIWTVNLYLGRDETIIRLAEGTPAPADTPLVLRQQVLAMDEETGAHAASGGSDVTDIDEFDAWITADPAHLAQVLPEPRGVVAIMARRAEKDYGDTFTSVAMNKANRETWWLIRNGGNLYRMVTDFQVGERLVPRRDEFTALFVDRYTGQRLEPGSEQWMKAEKAQGARERHFMRIALILQGLLDRTAVFHPLPTPPLSLLAPADYDTGRVVLLTDDEHQLTTGRTPFYTWLAAKNSMLTVGMRVLITTRHKDWPKRSTDRYTYDEHKRISPPRAEYPPSDEALTITRRGSNPGALVVPYDRTQEVWIRDEWGREELRTPKTRASVTIYPGDKFVLPIDLVTIAEMEEYLEARTERHAYADMFPTLRAAIAYKRAEAEAEAPFRSMLAAQIAQAENIDLDKAAGFVDEMVQWWKVGNRWHRPLSGDPAAEAKATKAILAERARRARAVGDTDRDAAMVARIRREHADVLLIARRKNGTYTALTPQPRAWVRPPKGKGNHWGDQVAPLDLWVTQCEYTALGTEKPAVEWVVPAPAVISRWITLFEGEAWAGWNKSARATEHLTDPEIEAGLAEIRDQPAPEGHRLIAVSYEERPGDYGDRAEFTAWYQPEQAPGMPENPLTGRLRYLYMQTQPVTWTKDRSGQVALRYGRVGEDNTTVWHVGHNTLIDASKRGRISPPWTSDRRAQYLIWTDEQALAAAQAQAEEWNSVRTRIAQMREEAHRLVSGVTGAWVERARAQAKARFLDDYGDESLWPEHEQTLTLTPPWDIYPANRRPKGYEGTGAALTSLVYRLVETGRPPYEQTVAEALAVLDEPLCEPEGYAHRGSFGGRQVSIAEDVLDLRFPGPRTQLADPNG